MIINCKRFPQLSLDELYEILKARSEVFVNEQQIIYQDMDDIDFKSSHMWISCRGRLCSYLRLIEPGVKYPEMSIGRVLTLKPFRHNGFSRILVTEAIAEARRRNSPVRLEAQAYLRDFYLSLGFRPVSDEFILEGIPHVEMILTPRP